ncbi:sulfatase family protein [Sinomicrobium weinanense]|uniref:Sulfatase n=1 Tax=Sinomicrobium weinanense TaxID=2842200 RepID=A0A926JVN8_9FLAO|nr:sulfatase [Sinomicrobium weinanense]MBC9798226.1 sulfatase [Sinomicrobium weinanense]MBU3125318.1 sulfatase [Sinomicrobium weinanense]
MIKIVLKVRSYLCLFILCICSGNTIGQENRTNPPNVVLIIADDVSFDDLGAYGNPFVQTPNIDELAKNGLKFNNAILTTSSCSPSRISIITGRYPHNTGAAELHTQPKVAFESIASKLRAKGYYTGQAGKWHMGKLLKQGFDRIYAKPGEIGDGGEARWLPSLKERDKNKPFFFWFASIDAHREWGENEFSDTHDPEEIEVPATLIDDDSTRIDLARYYDEIKRFDFHIGEVVKELKKQKVYDNTVIIVMSDNGRPFPRDKTRMYHSGIKTPLIIHWPEGIEGERVSNSLVSSIDIAPTILDICGIEPPETFQGKTFKALFDHPDKDFRKYAFAEHNWHDYEAHERMVRTKKHLYILNSRPELPNQGPLDIVNSPSFRSLVKAGKEGKLSPAQSDVFVAPRPAEELFVLKDDPLQVRNVVNKKSLKGEKLKKQNELIRSQLRDVLTAWMEETGDDIPGELTGDWYTRDTGEKIEKNFRKRGEMPGEKENADRSEEKGRF